jgi:hypothetical protein
LHRRRTSSPVNPSSPPAALDLPLLLTFEPSQPHQELRDVALHLLNLSTSPAQHRSTTAA